MSVSELIISQRSQIIEDTAEPSLASREINLKIQHFVESSYIHHRVQRSPLWTAAAAGIYRWNYQHQNSIHQHTVSNHISNSNSTYGFSKYRQLNTKCSTMNKSPMNKSPISRLTNHQWLVSRYVGDLCKLLVCLCYYDSVASRVE